MSVHGTRCTAINTNPTMEHKLEPDIFALSTAVTNEKSTLVTNTINILYTVIAYCMDLNVEWTSTLCTKTTGHTIGNRIYGEYELQIREKKKK